MIGPSRTRLLSVCILGGLAAIALGLPRTSHGGMLICETNTISDDDRASLVEGSQKLLDSADIDWSGANFCLKAGYAHAWFETSPVPQSDGSNIWKSVDCRRASGNWSCEATDKRSIPTTIQIPGGELTLTTQFPIDMDVDQARSLVTKTYDLIGSSLSSDQFCSGLATDSQIADLERSFFSSEKDSPVIVSFDNGDRHKVLVERDTYYLTFRPHPDKSKGDELSFWCWSYWIIVA